MKSSVAILVAAATAASLAGCGVFRAQDADYKASVDRPPLTVPPGLDQPVMDDALHIPDLAALGTRDVRRVDRPSSAAAGSLPGAFVIQDSAEGAWRRVGLALERLGGDVTVIEGDQAAGRYLLEVSGTEPAKGFFGRLMRREQRWSDQVDLRLTATGEGIQVAPAAASRSAFAVISRLRQRLGIP